ncbi:MAG: ribosomal protein S18-alanine N-acetyltransferase [Acidobacteria bacterium]|nr:ribosomal protein S18-alanine N-acetyltransferase [Acidobacteriota bacterium]
MTREWYIRPAELRDLHQLVEIEDAQFPEPWSQQLLRDELTTASHRRYTVAEHQDVVVGVLGLMLIEDDAHINTIATRPEWEGRGVARSLLDEALPVIAAEGYRRMTLEVAVSNARARALYTAYGFEPLGVRKQYYRVTNEDALVLVKYWQRDSHEP